MILFSIIPIVSSKTASFAWKRLTVSYPDKLLSHRHTFLFPSAKSGFAAPDNYMFQEYAV